MSNNRGIFETFPQHPASNRESPFAVVNESAEASAPASPFAPASRQESPFSVVEENAGARLVEPGRPAKVPERRRTESPFQVAEPIEGFGFEAPPKTQQSPFEIATNLAPQPPSPFAVAPQQPATPFAGEPSRPAATAPAAPAFGWPESAPAFAQQPAQPQATPTQSVPSVFAAQPPAQPAAVPSAFAQAPPVAADMQSDSFSIRQLELRAIFGVDREMAAEEILQRSRALPGMRNIAKVGPQEMATLEALKTLLPNLGFGNGTLKLYAGAVPLEFIREGPVLLAVQTDGGFAPGVRETLMLVARELGRLG